MTTRAENQSGVAGVVVGVVIAASSLCHRTRWCSARTTPIVPATCLWRQA